MASPASTTDEKRIVIIGGGVIGCTAAYFLTHHPSFNPEKHSVTILEATGIAGGASGKAGGLLADWATPQCLAPLSFKTHSDLAEKHGGDKLWGYRRVSCADVDLQPQPTDTKQPSSDGTIDQTPNVPPDLDWIHPSAIKSYTPIGTPRNSAQVHPYLFTTTMARLAQSAGATFLLGRATSLNHTPDATTITSVTYIPSSPSSSSSLSTPTTLPATDILLALGPWTPHLLPTLPLLAPLGHSIVLQPPTPLSPHVLFPTPPSSIPELYPRPPDPLHPTAPTLYAAGPDDYTHPLAPSTATVPVDARRCADLLAAARGVSVGDVELLAQQACYKPQIRRHEEGEEVGPAVGAVPGGLRGLWVATGHDEWGVANAAGTGVVVAEMVWEGRARSAEVGGLDPGLFMEGGGGVA